MKKIFIFVVITTLLSACASIVPFDKQDEKTKVFEFPGMSKNNIYVKTREFLSNYIDNSQTSTNKKVGRIIREDFLFNFNVIASSADAVINNNRPSTEFTDEEFGKIIGNYAFDVVLKKNMHKENVHTVKIYISYNISIKDGKTRVVLKPSSVSYFSGLGRQKVFGYYKEETFSYDTIQREAVNSEIDHFFSSYEDFVLTKDDDF